MAKTDINILGWLVAMLFSVQHIVSQEDGVSHSRGFFNASQNSLATVNNVLSLQSHITFSFRTCSSGSLVAQTGLSGDHFEISVNEQGFLDVAWTWQGSADGATFTDDALNTNQWFTVDILFLQGEITLNVEQGSTIVYSHLISNSTFREYLWDLSLSDGTGILIGQGFTGCIQEGLELALSASDTQSNDVQWGECPLEDVIGCGASSLNPCWQYPCLNGGTCDREGETGYTCTCPVVYSGQNCELDLGVGGCDVAQCHNGGTCLPQETGSRSYVCTCVPGFTGVNCEVEIDECVSEPCQNNARCTDMVNAFSCDCLNTGYEGNLCQENIDECTVDNPCQSGALCMDTPGSYKCQCPTGIGGQNCDNIIDECASNPCQNFGTCSDDIGFFSCSCVVGFTGSYCEVNIDDCEGVSCSDPLTHCVDGVNTHSCQCLPGYGGSEGNCVEVDECSSQPCVNGATCVNELNYYTCLCVLGYAGSNCETDIDDCAAMPCQNGANCTDLVGDYSCACLPGFEDQDCSTDINECSSQPCTNGAECQDQVNGFTCECVPGWEGPLCSEDIDECGPQPCQNGAVCQDLIGSFQCECPPGFTGSLCEDDINECEGEPCQNGGECTDMVDGFQCNCTDDWMGDTCELVYDACSSTPCENDATCVSEPPAHDFTCSCVDGYTGALCDANIDDCEGHDCAAYEICEDGINAYTCSCPAGFDGDLCAVEIDECDSSPCQNDGTCHDGLASYSCTCIGETVDLTSYTENPLSVYRTGYEGDDCEIEINECEFRPPICLNGGECRNSNGSFSCLCSNVNGIYYTGPFCEKAKEYCEIVDDPPACYNGGTCSSLARDYMCTCAAGFTGDRCETNIDECESQPCLMDGTCHDGVNMYTCECIPGLTGPQCDVNIDECSSQPCNHNGQCLDVINGYTCNCTDTGFVGDYCEVNIDDCASTPCQNGGNCTDGIKEYVCHCHQGYTGQDCEIDIAECESSPCQNGGACSEMSDRDRADFTYASAAGYMCTCLPGYTGAHCETDIDECESAPCQYGSCMDGVSSFTCQCFPGYTGELCDIEIDECAVYAPCKNGATCEDLVGMYQCVCALDYMGVQYGGQNCSVPLTGCQDHMCQNEATCIPYLVNEASNLHNYTCDCPYGFTGFYCDVMTTMSLSGSSWLYYDSIQGTGLDLLDTMLRFRTTLADGLLLLILGEESGSYLLVTLEEGSHISLRYQTVVESGVVNLGQDLGLEINSALWQQLELSPGVITNTLQATLTYTSASAASPTVHSVTADITSFTIREMHFAGNASGNMGIDVSPGFTGCIQDIQVGMATLPPESSLIQTSQVVVGCTRTDQCVPDPCFGHGSCSDLWLSYTCQCNRPWLGTNCNESFIAATFGNNGEESYVQYAISGAQHLQMATGATDVSFFFRTRQSDTLLFYMGGDPYAAISAGQLDALTYIAARLLGGNLVVQVKLGTEVQNFDFDSSVLLNDGEQHYLAVYRDGDQLTVTVDDRPVASYTLNVVAVFEVDIMVLGYIPEVTSTRRKRQADTTTVEQPWEAPTFEGTIQDLQLNDESLQFFHLNETTATDLPPVVEATEMSNVEAGEVSDDICLRMSPCENNATCLNVFFNDFTCECPEGFKGRNCSELNYCLTANCPGNSTCKDVLDGYECVIAATFNGDSSQAAYDLPAMTFGTTFTLSMQLRTRETSGTLFHMAGGSGTYITLGIQGGELQLQYNLGREDSYSGQPSHSVVDGSWHQVELLFGTDSFNLKLDDTLSYESSSQENTAIGQIYEGSSSVFVGGVDSTYHSQHSAMFFSDGGYKGCLNEVRITNLLLPFFYDAELGNETSPSQLSATSLVDLIIGCHGDPVCDAHGCVNGATCLDIFNDYTCTCVLGYNGTLCELDIDECVGNECQNEAECVDGVNEYSCSCRPGFTSQMCEVNIDECTSDPCENGGQCEDAVNAYFCNCSSNYTGSRCQFDINDNCDNSPCLNNGTCTQLNETEASDVPFNCSCMPGYEGDRCETEIDYCKNESCLNGATCESITNRQTFECQCAPGYTGSSCETELDECDSDPCANGATCTDLVDDYNCTCSPGWEGRDCDEDIDECNGTLADGEPPCMHGVCVNMPGSYYCNCSGTGYNGTRCELDIDECEQDPCRNGGNCTNYNGSYVCDCSLGYEGVNCEQVNCSHGQCSDEGTCVDDGINWSCNCSRYVFGDRCEGIGGCFYDPCASGSTCEQDGVDYTCHCAPGYTGRNCSSDIDECEDEGICENGATCTNLEPGYQCECAPGWTGANCETNIDECESQPCENGGICEDGINGYTCDCKPGYTGANCESDIDECEEPQACSGNGDCQNLDGTYECNCWPGYLGDTCHSLDPCNRTDYCANDGVCYSEVNNVDRNVSSNCTCTGGWLGPRCLVEDPLSEPLTGGTDIVIPLVVGLVAGVLIIIIAVVIFILHARKERAMHGTYSPSRQEMSGSRVEMGNVMKPPPEERLI